MQLQVEIRNTSLTFVNAANFSSAFVRNGEVATVHVALLTDNTYHWQYRTVDINGAVSPWSSFGGNAETDSDVTILNVPDTVPDAPTGLAQYKSDGVTSIPVGATTEETRFVLSATVSDPDGGMLRLRAEVRAVGTAFNGTATHGGFFFASGGTAIVEVANLSTGTSYHWRCWTEDPHGGVSVFVSFDPLGTQNENPPTNPADADFAVQPGANVDPDVPATPAQLTTSNGVIPVAGVIGETTVRFRSTLSDADGDGVRFQIEVRPAGVSFSNVPTSQSGFVSNGSVATIDLGSLAAGNYHWQYRAIDGAGRVSPWTTFSAGTDFSVVLAAILAGGGGGGGGGGCGLLGLEPFLMFGALLLRRRRT